LSIKKITNETNYLKANKLIEPSVHMWPQTESRVWAQNFILHVLS